MLVYDIAIVGGGLVGAGLAAALRETDLRVVLIDARMPQNDDPRLFALNAGSCEFLKNIGVWPAIAAAAAPIDEVHVSSRGRFGATRLKSQDADLSSLGNVVPAHVIEKALNNVLSESATCDIYRPATLHTLTDSPSGVNLVISTAAGDVELKASLIIGADGAESTVRQLANIAVESHDYEQSAIVTRTKLSRSHHNIAYERFTDNGTIAMLPLTGNECATIWSGDKSTIDGLLTLSDEAFVERLQIEFGYRLGRLKSIYKRHHYPLKMMRAETMAQGHIFLLGNAAHTLHPVAAQGFNLAMYEVAVLVEALTAATVNSASLNSALLQAVYADIKKQQTTSTDFSHRLAGYFADGKSVLGKLLPIGLVGLDLATPLRRRFVRKIMGRTGRVPRLLMSANT